MMNGSPSTMGSGTVAYSSARSIMSSPDAVTLISFSTIRSSVSLLTELDPHETRDNLSSSNHLNFLIWSKNFDSSRSSAIYANEMLFTHGFSSANIWR